MPAKTKNKAIDLVTHSGDRRAVAENSALKIPQWGSLAVLAFTALIYCRALRNGFTSIDDDFYILKNPYLKDFSLNGIVSIFTSFYSYNYHPLTTLTYLFEYALFGPDPLPFHLVNILLHLANTWLVFKLTEKLSGRTLTGIIVSAFFALHPMHVESVAWVSERKDVLYTLFYLLSLTYYLRYLESGLARKYYVFTLSLFLASLFSKSAAVTLPVLLVAIDFYKGRKINAKSLIEKIPFLLLSILFGILNIMAQAKGGAISDEILGAGLINRIFLSASALSIYFIKVLAPFGLCAMHYFPTIVSGSLPWQYYLSVPFIPLLVWLVLRRSSLRREFVFGCAFFLISISVMLQVVAVGSTLTAERYTYVAYIGLFYIFGQWVSGITQSKRRKVALIVTGFLLVVFSAQTWARIGVWKDDATLFKDIADRYPEIYLQFFERGNDKKKISHLREALREYNIAILLNPRFEKAYFARGELLNMMGNRQRALLDYNAAIVIKPGFADAYLNRGWAFYQSGNVANAMDDYRKTILLDSNNSIAYNDIGWAYYERKNMDSALYYFSKAISKNPGNSKALDNRAATKANSGDLRGAVSDYTALIKINPDNRMAYYYRGAVFMTIKDSTNAIADLRKSAELGNGKAADMLRQIKQ